MDNRLRSLQPCIRAHRAGRGSVQAAYLGGRLRLKRVPEPPFPSRQRGAFITGAPDGAAGGASQIASFTFVTFPTSSQNRSYSATSRRTFSSSGPRLKCRVTVLPFTDRATLYCGPCPGRPRLRACAVRLPAVAAHLIQRATAEIPDMAELPVQVITLALQLCQLLSLVWHHRLL